jgi:hypothetical protein
VEGKYPACWIGVGSRTQVEVSMGAFLIFLVTQWAIMRSPVNIIAKGGKVAISVFMLNWMFWWILFNRWRKPFCFCGLGTRSQYVYHIVGQQWPSLIVPIVGFQPSCHIAPSVRLLVPSRTQAHRHLFSEVACLWHLLSPLTAPSRRAGPVASAGFQPSFLVGDVSRCCSPLASSFRILVSSAIVLSRAHLPQCAFATCVQWAKNSLKGMTEIWDTYSQTADD